MERLERRPIAPKIFTTRPSGDAAIYRLPGDFTLEEQRMDYRPPAAKWTRTVRAGPPPALRRAEPARPGRRAAYRRTYVPDLRRSGRRPRATLYGSTRPRLVPGAALAPRSRWIEQPRIEHSEPVGVALIEVGLRGLVMLLANVPLPVLHEVTRALMQ